MNKSRIKRKYAKANKLFEIKHKNISTVDKLKIVLKQLRQFSTKDGYSLMKTLKPMSRANLIPSFIRKEIEYLKSIKKKRKYKKR